MGHYIAESAVYLPEYLVYVMMLIPGAINTIFFTYESQLCPVPCIEFLLHLHQEEPVQTTTCLVGRRKNTGQVKFKQYTVSGSCVFLMLI